jgi:beta-alanine--pyruvate transaminase
MNIQTGSNQPLEAHWMPFSANRDFKAAPRFVTRSEGMYLWNQNGDRLIDGCSGLFNVAAGHGRREIADAVHAQMLQNDYTPPFQLGHQGSFALATRLARMLPEPFNHVFFTNSGSESIDTALKMAMAYHRARGEGQRLRFVSRERAYHGVNIGGTSLAGMVRNRETFGAVMPNVVTIRHTWDAAETFSRGQRETGAELADDLQRHCETYGGGTIAAVFVEPVAGSTGTLVPPKGYLERLREICDAHGILLVFDEVITGFGRLGTAFAADAFGVMPDIITMAKALTNGAIPMGAVAVTDAVHATIVDAAPEGAIEFFHGYTYSGHPAACAAGLATLQIYEDEGLFERAAALSDYFLDAVWSLRDLGIVRDIRGYGLLAGVEVHPEPGRPGFRGTELQKRLFWNGCHVKWTGDTAIVAPALVAERGQVDEIVDVWRRTLAGA